MNKLLLLLFSIFLLGCCNESKLLDNGLTKSASKITEYTMLMDRDSLNKKIQDTLTITKKKYNNNDQISSSIERNLYLNDSMSIEFIYDENKKLEKEIVKLSTDSSLFIVDYFYNDTLLHKTEGVTANDIYSFKQIGEYEYNEDNTLKQSSLLQLYVEAETNDTITHTLETSKYDNHERVIESIVADFVKPESNRTTKYQYDCLNLIETKEYDTKDSLITKTEFKYVFDTFDNWTKVELIQNSKLTYIKSRVIEYK